ncbi:MAG: hotdog fold thioesterase [Nocardioidaceae bacterium]|nr:hotdog fold thioesterase [Nocardioidaceae bacterium]
MAEPQGGSGHPDMTSSLHDRMGIEIVEATPERVVGTMPVEGNLQPYGLLHGGASCVLAEGLGSIGAALHAHPASIAVGVDINATHHRAVRSGSVTGVATPIHLGRSVASYEVVIHDEQQRRVCTARITCHLSRSRPRA